MKSNLQVRRLGSEEEIPYQLLLLADEEVEVINAYITKSEIYVLEHEQRIAGVYALYSINTEIVEIKNIAVEESCQGKGFGTYLLADASSRAKINGFKTIIIGTGDAMTNLLYFYQKQGFEMFHIKNNFFIDNYSTPIYENGIQLKHMVMLKKNLV
jgi:N-acetylglutamate synthase-like GNAT family acetyltransferase